MVEMLENYEKVFGLLLQVMCSFEIVPTCYLQTDHLCCYPEPTLASRSLFYHREDSVIYENYVVIDFPFDENMFPGVVVISSSLVSQCRELSIATSEVRTHHRNCGGETNN